MDSKMRNKVAHEILAVVRDLLAAEQSRTMVSRDDMAELEKTAKACSELATDFKDKHAALIAEVNDLDKKLKEKKQMLSEYYKGWDKKSGYIAIKKAILAQAQECLDAGDMLEDLADDLAISKKVSMQPSYAQQLSILLSMLNAAEMNKYKNLLENYFKKNITTLNAGLSQLDGEIKDWHQEAQEIAQERGIKLPKASKMASAMKRAKERNAGILDALMDAIQGIIPNLVRKVMDWGKRLFKSVTRNGEELSDITNDLSALAAKAQKILA